MSIQILGTGSYLPACFMINKDLEKIVETSDEWIRTRTGIKKRYITSGKGTADMAAQAAKNALEMAKISAQDIDLIIVATLSGDYHTPSTACLVQAKIGAKNAVCFDLNAACSGFLFSMNTAISYMKTGMAKTALVIGAETLSKLVDWTDRSSCILFGDGAGAAILSCTESSEKKYNAVLHSDGGKAEALTCEEELVFNPFVKPDRNPNKICMDGQAIFKFAVKNVPVCIEELLKKIDIPREEIKYFILHQANERIIQSISKKLKLPIERFPMNLAECGNTSSASIPILLDELNRNGMLERGDKIVLSGFGGGLTWGAAYLEW
ncbi:MAG: beta-ketoacyl-ACP synthase III [Lachnospiraceae bacterium]